MIFAMTWSDLCQKPTLPSYGSKKLSLITSIDLKVNFRDMLGCGACITGMLRDKNVHYSPAEPRYF